MKFNFSIFALIFCIIAFFCSNALAGQVVFDQSFNNTGYRIEQISGFTAFGESLAIQTDGKIILGGTIYNSALLNDFVLIRVNPDGSLDTGFGNNGIVVTDVSLYDRADTIKLQPDGKILVAGDRYSFTTNDDFAVVRYNSDGSLDTSFGTDGVATANFNGSSDEHCNNMILQNDGKILLVGTTATDDSAQTDLMMARFSSTGLPDNTFGNGIGKVSHPIGVSFVANTALVYSNGRIDVAGFYTVNSTRFYMRRRFNANGSMFVSKTGFAFTQSGSVTISDNIIRNIALQSDGKVVFHLGMKTGKGSVFVRYLPNGDPDGSFGIGYIATSRITANSMIIQSDDKILLGGNSGSNFAVSRLTANGMPDTNFDDDGTAVFEIPSQNCVGKSVAIQNDSKIVVGGTCSNYGENLAIFRVQETNFTE